MQLDTNQYRIVRVSGFGAAFLALITAIVIASSSSPDPGFTGAPSEGLCVQCHQDFEPNFGPGSLAVILPSSYIPGGIYTVRVRIEQPGESRWGFQVTAIDPFERRAGRFIITDTVRTQLQYRMSLDRFYVNHTSIGTFADSADGPIEWVMDWQAPEFDAGTVTFYACGVAADNNGGADGDYVYTAVGAITHDLVGDTTKFRTFRPESLYVKNAVKLKSIGTGWRATFLNSTGSTMTGIEIHFRRAVTLTFYAPFPEAFTVDGGETWFVTGQEIGPGDSTAVWGTSAAGMTEIREWRYVGYEPTAFNPGFLPQQGGLLPMPNAANFRGDVFSMGGFAPGTSESDSAGGMVIGTSFMRFEGGRWKVNSDSAKIRGWVRLKKGTAVLRSLRPDRNGVTHTGPPRGFCFFDDGTPFVRQKTVLMPRKMSNHLFAELVALKMNIAASTLGITPPGFGELKYEDNGHMFDELMVKQIANQADIMMTYCAGRNPGHYIMLDTVLTKINTAFSGSIDTISFAGMLRLTGVRPVGEVPFLRRDRSIPPTLITPTYHAEYDDTDEEESDEELVQEKFHLAQNYPNPFNPSTTIEFELPTDALVTIKVYNVLGQEVATLADREMYYEGTNEVEFGPRTLSSGVYFYHVIAEELGEGSRRIHGLNKMLLLK